MEKSLKDQMSDVLAVEREKNNLALTPVKRGITVPNNVRQAKIAYIERRKSEGVDTAKASKEAGISWHSYYAWKREFAGKPGYHANRKSRAKRVMTTRAKEMQPRKRFTEAERLELVHKLRRLLNRGMSQREASAKLGLRPGTASRWLMGHVPLSATDRKRRPNPSHKDNGEVKPIKVVRKESPKTEYISIGEAMTAYRNAGSPDDFEKELLRAIIRRT